MVTWQQLINDWDTSMQAIGLAASTRKLRRGHVHYFADAHPKGAATVTSQDITDWFSAHSWKPATRQGYRISLGLFYGWATRTRKLHRNPIADFPYIRVPQGLPRPAPDSNIERAFVSTEENPRDRLLIEVFTYTGMRLSEVAALHVTQLELIPGDGWNLRVVGKRERVRLIPIDELLAARIGAHDGYVFPGRTGDGHLHRKTVGEIIKRALGGGWTAHTVRHRYATRAYAETHDIRAVQELLGHASVATTQIYTFTPRDAIRRAATGAGLGIMTKRSHA